MTKKTRRQRRMQVQQPSTPVVNARSLRVQRMMLDSSLTTGYLGQSFSGDRDYYTILGYPKELQFEHFFTRYEREHIAARIIDFPAEETWRDKAEVLDGTDKDARDDTQFATAFMSLAKRTRLFHYCQRADKMAGIGRYGVLLIGTTGTATLDQPIERLSSVDDILYLRPYSEYSAQVEELVTDPADERYGLPLYYSLEFINNAKGTSEVSQRVHWSRVIHVAEGLLENEVYGRPRLQRVYNLLDDVMKLIGGSAEATWKLMRKGFVLDVDPEANLSAEAELALEEQIDEYDHGLRRFMKTRGMNVMDLGSEVVDPTGPFTLIIDLIAGATGIPQRILLGSERGELASSQDAANWAGRIADRRENWAEPVILRALIDRLIDFGALPAPSSGEYSIKWKPLFELTDSEKANLANTWAQAIATLSAVSGTQVVTTEEWRGEFSPFPAEMPEQLPTMAREQQETAQQQAEEQANQEADRQQMMQQRQMGRPGMNGRPAVNTWKPVEVDAVAEIITRALTGA